MKTATVTYRMKKITLILLFIICKLGIAQSYEMYGGDTINMIDAGGKRQGRWIIFGRMKKDPKYAPDAKVEEGKYLNSMKTGIWIEYFPTGVKKSELTFQNNRANGPAVMYHENGKKAEEGNWQGSRWVGPYKLYYEDGTIRQEFSYNPLGQRDGVQKYYHPNGKLMIEVTMKAGKEEGMMKEYYENGELKAEKFFNGGNIDPAKSRTYEPKKPVAESQAPEEKELKAPAPVAKANEMPNKGQFTGEGYWILYTNGQITMKGTFHLKKLIDGEQRIYDQNGMLIRIKLFKEGRYVGDGPLPVEGSGGK
jgi:antitoxin component YwqK of YwqJK toxin-antitoxin module